MSSLIVEAVKIDEIIPIENADKIEIIVVKGWNCIVGKNNYKVGDVVIFIPPDSIVPQDMIEKYELTYLKDGGRIRTVKLRGIISQGLIISVDFPVKIGEDLSSYFGITKWTSPEPKYASSGGGQVSRKKINPLFSVYTDIENIKHFNDVFSDVDDVVFTEKLHGCNFRAGNLPIGTNEMGSFSYRILSWIKKNIPGNKYEFVYGSHKVQKSGSTNPNHFYREDIWGKVAKKYNLAKILPSGYIFYGEVAGEADGERIQDLTYSLKEHALFIFDINDVSTGKYLDWDTVLYMCNVAGLPHVPELYRGKYSDELRKKYTTGKSFIDGKTIREGIVIKPLTETNNRKIGRKILKSVSEEYLLRKNPTEYT